eukprot:15158912-Alexandrium_andersonii.AAC.1
MGTPTLTPARPGGRLTRKCRLRAIRVYATPEDSGLTPAGLDSRALMRWSRCRSCWRMFVSSVSMFSTLAGCSCCESRVESRMDWNSLQKKHKAPPWPRASPRLSSPGPGTRHGPEGSGRRQPSSPFLPGRTG